jgi:hypothetical protein
MPLLGSETSQQSEDHLTHRVGCVDGLGHASQYDTVLLLQVINRRNTVEKISGKTVEVPHQQGRVNSSFGELENTTESLTLGWLPGARDPAIRFNPDQLKALRLGKRPNGALLSLKTMSFRCLLLSGNANIAQHLLAYVRYLFKACNPLSLQPLNAFAAAAR